MDLDLVVDISVVGWEMRVDETTPVHGHAISCECIVLIKDNHLPKLALRLGIDTVIQ